MLGRALLGLVVAIGTPVMLVAAPASALTVSINPTEGPAGTVITVTVPSCDGGTPGATLEDSHIRNIR